MADTISIQVVNPVRNVRGTTFNNTETLTVEGNKVGINQVDYLHNSITKAEVTDPAFAAQIRKAASGLKSCEVDTAKCREVIDQAYQGIRAHGVKPVETVVRGATLG